MERSDSGILTITITKAGRRAGVKDGWSLNDSSISNYRQPSLRLPHVPRPRTYRTSL